MPGGYTLPAMADVPLSVADTLRTRAGEAMALNDRYLNPQLGRIVRTLGDLQSGIEEVEAFLAGPARLGTAPDAEQAASES